LAWKKPDDLEVVAECETLPEAEIVRGLLQSVGIEGTIVATTDSTIIFSQRSVFGKTAKRVPYKILVHPDDQEAAQGLLEARSEDMPDGD